MAGNNIWFVLAFLLPGKFTEALKRDFFYYFFFLLKDKTVGFSLERVMRRLLTNLARTLSLPLKQQQPEVAPGTGCVERIS